MGQAMDTPPLPPSISPATAQALWEQVAWVTGRAQERKGLVYFPPSIGWEIPSFQRPHHLARAFALEGYAVVFDCRNAGDAVFGFKEVEPDIFLFKAASQLLTHLPVSLVWCFVYNIPHRLEVSLKAPLVYDIIDVLEVFPYDQAFLKKNHTWALRWADVVTCVSRELLQEIAQKRPDALYLPNAVEAWRFDTQGVAIPEDPALKPFFEASAPESPVAGYCGSLAHWFDFDFLQETARRLPGWRFLIIGPHLDLSGRDHAVFSEPNVFYLGPRPYPTIPFYLDLFTVGILPFRGEGVLRGLSPLKIYEYLASGKPAVVTPFPEASGLPGVFQASDPSSFAQALERAAHLAADETRRGRLREFARRESWLARVETFLAHLQEQGIHPVPMSQAHQALGLL